MSASQATIGPTSWADLVRESSPKCPDQAIFVKKRSACDSNHSR